MAWPALGCVLGERYRVEDTLGMGGMGAVLAAVDLRTGMRVAIKIPRRITSVRDRERFAREARLAARLAGPHVTRILDTGTTRHAGSELPFLVFEYLDGADLATWLAAHGRVTVADAATIAVQACDAVAEAHAHGIVHRDLKPANLMLASTCDGVVVKVLDFGISRGVDDGDGAVTTGPIGFPAYMAPEQMRPSAMLDARADVWSLGVMLYEAISGRRPFIAEAFPDLCLRVMLDDPPPLPDDVPAGFAAVVHRCLDKDPARRWSSADALAHALRPYAGAALSFTTTDLELVAVESAVAATSSRHDAAPHPSIRRSRLGAWVVITAIMAFASDARTLAVGAAIDRHVTAAHAETAKPTAIATRLTPLPAARIAAPAVGPSTTAPTTHVTPAAAHSDPPAPHIQTTARERVAAAPGSAWPAPTAADPLASPF